MSSRWAFIHTVCLSHADGRRGQLQSRTWRAFFPTPAMSARRVDFIAASRLLSGAGSGVRSQPPPATMVQMLARAVRDMNPLGDQLEEMRGAARRAIGRAANAVVTHLEESKDRVAPAPASLSLSRAYSPLRHGRFAAMIPGDSAVEQVITSGLFSTLNIYNTLLIGRLILTWCVAWSEGATLSTRKKQTQTHVGAHLKTHPSSAFVRVAGSRTPPARSCTRSPLCATRT